MIKIKICGLSRECDIDYVNEAQPDFVGFVFAKSKRQITKQQAIFLKKKLDINIKVVGVFVNADIDYVNDILDAGIIDIVQLHGNEDDKYILRIKQITDKPIIKAVRVENKDSIIRAENMIADYLLFDNGNGGTGKAFDWEIIGKEIKKPFFLAGGINVQNATNGIEITNPYAIDISSGVETNGVKDKAKILEIIRIIRNE